VNGLSKREKCGVLVVTELYLPIETTLNIGQHIRIIKIIEVMKKYKNRVQLQNPMTKEWVKVNTKTGRIIGRKKTPWKNIKLAKSKRALNN